LGGIAQMFCVIQSTARVTDMSTWDIRCRIQPTCAKYLDGVDGAALLTFLHLYLQPTSVSFFLSFFGVLEGPGGWGEWETEVDEIGFLFMTDPLFKSSD